MISKLQLRCENEREGSGCPWIGTLAAHDRHVADKCPFLKVPCGLDGCCENVDQQGLTQHRAACDSRLLICEHCSEPFKACLLEAHLGVCDSVIIVCHYKCEETFRRRKEATHQTTCTKAPVHFSKFEMNNLFD